MTSSDQSCTSCFNTQPPEGGCGKSCAVGRAKHGFNTQPPEGGCDGYMQTRTDRFLFQHTAARRRLPRISAVGLPVRWFQHTAARRRLPARDLRFDLIGGFQHTAARRRLRPEPLLPHACR